MSSIHSFDQPTTTKTSRPNQSRAFNKVHELEKELETINFVMWSLRKSMHVEDPETGDYAVDLRAVGELRLWSKRHEEITIALANALRVR